MNWVCSSALLQWGCSNLELKELLRPPAVWWNGWELFVMNVSLANILLSATLWVQDRAATAYPVWVKLLNLFRKLMCVVHFARQTRSDQGRKSNVWISCTFLPDPQAGAMGCVLPACTLGPSAVKTLYHQQNRFTSVQHHLHVSRKVIIWKVGDSLLGWTLGRLRVSQLMLCFTGWLHGQHLAWARWAKPLHLVRPLDESEKNGGFSACMNGNFILGEFLDERL